MEEPPGADAQLQVCTFVHMWSNADPSDAGQCVWGPKNKRLGFDESIQAGNTRRAKLFFGLKESVKFKDIFLFRDGIEEALTSTKLHLDQLQAGR